MISMGALSDAAMGRLPRSARVTTFLTRRQARPQPDPGPVPAPPGDDILRTRPGSVDMILSHAGASPENFLAAMGSGAIKAVAFAIFLAFPAVVVVPIVYSGDQTSTGGLRIAVLALGAAALLFFIGLLFAGVPAVLRLRFATAGDSVKLRVVQLRPTRLRRFSALSSITIVEYRYRRPGELPADDAQREIISSLPHRIDVALHRTDGSLRLFRGESHKGWQPDPRNLYGPLAELLAPAGVTIERRFIWTDKKLVPPRPNRYVSPGSGSANVMGC
jgi:hypothetical protein